MNRNSLAVPSETSSVSEVFYRITTFSLTQLFGDQVNVSNCIQALEIVVFKIITYCLK